MRYRDWLGLAFSLLAASACAEQPEVVVQSRRVLEESSLVVEGLRELEQERDEISAMLEEEDKAIQDLTKLVADKTVPPTVRARAAAQLEAKQDNYSSLVELWNRIFRSTLIRLEASVRARMADAIRAYEKAHDVRVVIVSGNSGQSEARDVTTEVILLMNEEQEPKAETESPKEDASEFKGAVEPK